MRTLFVLTLTALLGMVTHVNTWAHEHGPPLEGKRVAIMVAEGFQDAEALVPMAYLINRGAQATVIGLEPGEVKAYNSGITMWIEKAIEDVSVDDFDALVLPGGRGPAALRQNEAAVEFARAFFETGKATAAICHGPQVLITAGVLDGKKATGFSRIRDELVEAGALYEDVSVLRDGHLVTSRLPMDLDDFCSNLLDVMLGN